MQKLDDKYRPRSWDELIGCELNVKSIRAQLASDSRPHAFMLYGVSGAGKTSTARLIAKELGCTETGLNEFDAARNSGIDNIRELIGDVGSRVFGSPVRVFVIDECHNISKLAFDTFLKTIEEPPPHVYFVFLTTDIDKVPEPVRNRCVRYKFSPLDDGTIRDYVEVVSDIECLNVPADILDLVALSARGSVRAALNNLSIVGTVRVPAEAELLLGAASSELPESIISLVDKAIEGEGWDELKYAFAKIPQNLLCNNHKPELLNHVLHKLMDFKNNPSVAQHLAMVLDCVDQMPNYPAPFEHKSALMLMLWRIILLH